MAQKQYSFDFVLNAVLNGGFSAVFTKAQQEFIRLGAEIKNLQAIQRDVKAYEKQDKAVQNSTAKLENLEKQLEKLGQEKGFLQKQIEETEKAGKSTAALERQFAALERKELEIGQKIGNTSAALEKQKQKLGETKDRLDAAGVSTTDLANKDAELTAKIQELTEEQKRAAEGAGEFGNAGVQAIEAVGGAIAAAGIAEAMKGIADGYRECVEVAGNFEQAMSAVEAIANSNVSEMAALTAEAKELGANTKFTAQQSGNAMEYMAMAGWDAQEMLNGMSGVINLAAAAGEDLAQVSDIVTDNLSAFGLRASDTAHFADVLAAAAANSNTNISIMGETFKSSSSVAGALGYSIEDVAVMVGLMANNSVKGSRAGTALRNIFNGLLGGVTLTAKAFGELDYSAVNSDGSMKGLMETVEDLRGYFSQMTEAERVNNAMTIAGMRGYNGLLAILNATNEDFTKLYSSVTNCTGAAERMASVKLDNLNGDITLMDSAMEALQSTIGEQFNPELRELTQLKTELLNGMNDFIIENPALAKGVMAGAAAFGVMGTAIVGVNAAIKVFKALELATLFTGPAGVLLGVAAGIAGVTAAVVGFVEAKKDGGAAVRELTVAARDMWETMDEVNAAYEDTKSTTTAVASVAERYIGRLRELEAAEGGSAETSREYQETLALLLQVMPSLSDCIGQTTDEYGRSTYVLNTSKDALLEHVEALKQEAIAQALTEKRTELYAKYADVLLESEQNSLKKREAEDKLALAQERRVEILQKLAEQEAAAPNYHGGYFDTDVDAARNMSEEYRALQSQLEACDGEIADCNKTIDDCTNAMNRDAAAAASAETELDLLDKTQQRLEGTSEGLTSAEADVQNVFAKTMESVQALTEAYADAYDEALESFSGQFGLFDEAKADAEATVEAAQKALDTQLAYWQGYAANIAALKEISAKDLGVTQENYNTLMEYVRSGTPEAAGLAADMVKAINDGNTQALADLANTLGEISESQDQAALDVAEWTKDLNEQMDRLISDMEEEIRALDMSEEAAKSGRATVQAYIDAADNMLPQVQSAYARVVSRARRALSNAAVASSDWDGSYYSIPGHAGGTNNAPPGWSWVGEEGPELMRMHGGEQILPSHISQEVARTYRAYNKYSGEYAAARAIQGIQSSTRPALEVVAGGQTSNGAKMEMHFHIEAGASPETVNAWQDYANRGELKAVVLEVMEEADADMKRRVMG